MGQFWLLEGRSILPVCVRGGCEKTPKAQNSNTGRYGVKERALEGVNWGKWWGS